MARTQSGTSLPAREESVSDRVVEAVARREGTSLTAFDVCLYEVIDPDALDDLFQGDRFYGSVEFAYLGYQVVVHADGQIDLHDDDDKQR